MPPCSCQHKKARIDSILMYSSASIFSFAQQNSISIPQDSSTYDQSRCADSEVHHQADCRTTYMNLVWAGISGDSWWSTLFPGPFPSFRLRLYAVMHIQKINTTFKIHSALLYPLQTVFSSITSQLLTQDIVTLKPPSSTKTTTKTIPQTTFFFLV